MSLKNYIKKVIEGENLSFVEAKEAMNLIMTGNSTPAQTAGLITALRMKGETIDEITAFASVMRDKAATIDIETKYSVDTCGTGGDGLSTFNISTAAAIICAAGGVTVCKHGNRAVSSKSGCADVLESFGVKIDLEPAQVKKCIEKTGIGFMFAPKFHSSMKYAVTPRKELGIRTVFNILGPLTNPAKAKSHLMGVFSKDKTEVMARVLKGLDVKKALVVHGSDGLDEITLTGKTYVTELNDGEITSYDISPKDFGLNLCSIDDLKTTDSGDSAKIIMDILSGKSGAKTDIVLLNSGAAFYASGIKNSIEDGIQLAREVIEGNKAKLKLEEFIEVSNAV